VKTSEANKRGKEDFEGLRGERYIYQFKSFPGKCGRRMEEIGWTLLYDSAMDGRWRLRKISSN